MKLPTRLSVALATAITGLLAVIQELDVSHPVKQVSLIVGALVLALVVHPGESGTVASSTEGTPPFTIGAPAPPAAPAAPAPGAQSLS